MNITDAAFDRIEQVVQQDDFPDNCYLRVYITGGGCSGFQYGFKIEEQQNPDDTLYEKGVAKVVVDPMSLMYLMEATLDFKTDIQGEVFVISNPHAKTSCGCGKSFAV